MDFMTEAMLCNVFRRGGRKPVKPTSQHSTIDTAGSRAYCITDTTMGNFSNVIYTSREFNLSNQLSEDSPGFGEP